MQRFSVKKWWSVVGSDKGVFVYYDEAQAMIDRLRADRDRHRNDNKLLWERIAQQQRSFRETSRLNVEIYTENNKLRNDCKLIESLAIFLTLGLVGVVSYLLYACEAWL